MKALLFLLLLVVCGVGIAYLMHQDPGYILIAYKHYTVETTLWFGLLALILIIIVLKIVLGVFKGVFSFKSIIQTKQNKKHLKKSQALLEAGMLNLFQGEFEQANNALKKGAKYRSNALLNELGCAYALHQLQQNDDSNAVLEQALKAYDQQQTPILYVQSKLLLDGQCYQKAQQSLEAIDKKDSKTAFYFEMLVQCYCGLQEYVKAQKAYDQLKRCKHVHEEKLLAFGQSIVIGNLTTINIDDLEKYWSSLDKKDRQFEAYIWLVADRFIENDRYKKASALLMQAIKQISTEELWEMLALCVVEQAESILQFCQKMLKYEKDQWFIYYCAGVAAVECGDINQAKQHLVQANNIQTTEAALLLLADIYNQQGLKDELYQSCLSLLKLES